MILKYNISLITIKESIYPTNVGVLTCIVGLQIRKAGKENEFEILV